MKIRRLAKLSAIGLVAVAALGAGFQTYHAHTGFYGPRDVPLLFARPTLRWEVWSDGYQVTGAEMQLNGKAVDAHYDAQERALSYTPATSLSPGANHVECAVTVDGKAVFRKSWDTLVAPNAADALPSPDERQTDALTKANALRRQVGLPEMAFSDNLNVASQRHCQYLAQNGLHGHEERAGLPGYFGATGADRLQTFGYGGSSWEGVTHGEDTIQEAVQNLFDAPYHRQPFLQPGTIVFGAGRAAKDTTIEFSGGHAAGVVVSPGDGQTDVPRRWDATEEPDPLRMHSGAELPTGYPILLCDFGVKSLAAARATLEADGKAVPFYLNSPQNDDALQTAVFVIPVEPLKPNTTYRVSVHAQDEAGNPIDRSWSFTTASPR